MAMLAGLMAGCGSAAATGAPVVTGSVKTGAALTPSPAAFSGACGSVAADTPLTAVDPGCATTWAEAGLSLVPPADVATVAGARSPTSVLNRTGDTAAPVQAWAAAYVLTESWISWGDAHAQSNLLMRITGPLEPSPGEKTALDHGEPVSHSSGCVQPGTVTAYAMTSADQSVFAQSFLYPTSTDVLAVSLPQGCQVTAAGVTVLSVGPGGTVIVPGHLVDDPFLGTIWYAELWIPCGSDPMPSGWCPGP